MEQKELVTVEGSRAVAVELAGFKLPVLREEKGRYVIAEMPYSAHPDDTYLTLVLCVYKGQFVTWVYNRSDAGFYYGRYFDTAYARALEDFIERRSGDVIEGARRIAQRYYEEHGAPQDNDVGMYARELG